MTQYFAYRGFRLWRAPLHTRVLLTLFDVMMVLATMVGILMWRVRTHLNPAGVRAYYLGNEGSAGAGQPLLFARSFQELLDVTHAHAFSQSFLFFILCHLFALTRVPSRWKVVVYVAAFGSVVIDLGTPYLVRYVSPVWAPLQVVNSALMTVVLGVLLVVPIHEMWFKREPTVRGTARRRRAAPRRAEEGGR
ncbi:MAG TPA: hypothetical protein VFK13_01745 [Gemmatimonadaceae bacterium]|nr:hypothetical protein [Gemmatimonadaceae bacterium]